MNGDSSSARAKPRFLGRCSDALWIVDKCSSLEIAPPAVLLFKNDIMQQTNLGDLFLRQNLDTLLENSVIQ